MILIWRTVCQVREKGELERREFPAEGTVGGLKRGSLGVFCGDFSNGSD